MAQIKSTGKQGDCLAGLSPQDVKAVGFPIGCAFHHVVDDISEGASLSDTNAMLGTSFALDLWEGNTFTLVPPEERDGSLHASQPIALNFDFGVGVCVHRTQVRMRGGSP